LAAEVLEAKVCFSSGFILPVCSKVSVSLFVEELKIGMHPYDELVSDVVLLLNFTTGLLFE